jgi:hypothetical protein
VAVQPMPVGSPARSSTRSRRATSPLPASVGHRPTRRAAPALATPRSPAPVVATPVQRHRPHNRAPRTLRDGVGALLGVFVAATLVMVTAVIVVGSVDRLWILAPVMLVDFATTFGVVSYIMRLLADDGESPA